MTDRHDAAPSFTYGLQPPAELYDLADEVRRIIDHMMVIEEPHHDLRELRSELEAIAERLRQRGRRGLQARMTADVAPGPDDLRPYYAGNARRWHYNPLFPRLRVEAGDGVLRARVTLGLPYEGPPGCVHGGLVAMLFDQVLGQNVVENGLLGMTGTLSVRYRKPTPLLQELLLEADRPELADGRKCTIRGRIRCGDVVTAEAQGLFVLPNFSGTTQLPLMHRGDAT